MSTIRSDGRIFANVVLEEPEPGRGIAAVAKAIEAGIENQMTIARIVVSGRIRVGDVILGLRLGGREEPLPLLNSQNIFRAPSSENIIRGRIDFICHKARSDRSARWWGSGAIVGENLIPVVRNRCRS